MAGPLASGPSWRQTALINDLLEAIEADPANAEAHKLLAEQYQALGWDDAAADVAEAILQLDPTDHGAAAMLTACGRKHARIRSPLPVRRKPPSSKTPSISLEQLRDGYQSLRDEATNLLREMLVFQELAPDADCLQQIADLNALAEGRMFSVARGKVSPAKMTKYSPPRSARALAASMKSDRSKAVEIAILDFENVIRWARDGTGQPEQGRDTDALRDTLRKRVDTVKSALPNDMAYHASDAFMHVEHEVLRREYANAETILGDSISEIPRNMFWSSEDGYAWDMSELVQAIKANKCAMRNPLTRENFTVGDVEAIVRHPVGQELAAIQIEQSQLFRGVRQDTISRLESMAKILLEDDTENSHVSHNAVDDFLSYVATLPADERKAIDNLRVPATDSHTGQEFDDTIGDAVRDAKGNRICFHKAGDLLRQAAVYLGKGNSA